MSRAYTFDELVGQTGAVERLKRFGELYSARTEVPEHILFVGNEGMGRRTFARAFAMTFNLGWQEVEAKELQRKGDLTAILTSLDARQGLLIANLQDLRKPLVEVLQPALERFQIDLIIGQGSGARIHPFLLNRFTLLATAPRLADVPPDLLQCFSLSLAFEPYSNLEMGYVAVALAARGGLTLAKEVVPLLVSVSHHDPGAIEQWLRRFARLGRTTVTEEEAREVFAALGLVSSPGTSVIGASGLDSLSGVEFEKLITSLLRRMGFRADMTRASGDGGVDIVAHLDRPIVGGRYLIQCKRFESLVGAPIIREFYGAVVADRKAVKGIFITTSGFTDQARAFAESLPLELIDRRRLDSLLAEFDQEA